MTAPAPDRAQGATGKPLSAKEKRAAREAARRQVVAEERARIAAARAAEGGGTPAAPPDAPAAASPAAPPPAADPSRTAAERQRDAALFLRGVLFPLLAVLAGFTPWRLDLDKFTDAQAEEDAKAWVPLLERYTWLDRVCAWVGAPARLVARVRQLAARREPVPGDPKPAVKAVA